MSEAADRALDVTDPAGATPAPASHVASHASPDEAWDVVGSHAASDEAADMASRAASDEFWGVASHASSDDAWDSVSPAVSGDAWDPASPAVSGDGWDSASPVASGEDWDSASAAVAGEVSQAAERIGDEDAPSELDAAVSRVGALHEFLRAAEGHVPEPALASLREVVGRAGERLELSRDHTVVALAGATGSGKSSIFNGLAGMALSQVGVRRPLTSVPHACVWRSDGAAPLLDWLGVPANRRFEPGGDPDGDHQAPLRGLVLLDMPDFDSVDQAHRSEVDRLLPIVDLVIWVLDPQKYADNAVHEQYLRHWSRHRDITLVALNQADTLGDGGVEQCLADLQRLLDADGLTGVPLLATSTVDPNGLDGLRAALEHAVTAHGVYLWRLVADLATAISEASPLVIPGSREPENTTPDTERATPDTERATPDTESDARRLVSAEADPVDRAAVRELVEILATAAGVPAVTAAVERAYLTGATAATGWTIGRWARRLRRDPLRRLRLDAPEPDVPGANAPEAGVSSSGASGAGVPSSGAPEAYIPSSEASETDIPSSGTPEADALWPEPSDGEVAKVDEPGTDIPSSGAPEPEDSDGESLETVAAQQAAVSLAVRGLAEHCSLRLPEPWRVAVSSAAAEHHDEIPLAMEQAIARTDLAVADRPGWWRAANVLQWSVTAVVLAALAWHAGWLASLGFDFWWPVGPRLGPVPLAAAVLVGALLIGVLLDLAARPVRAMAARHARRLAERRLNSAIAEVASDLVVAPVRGVLRAYWQARSALTRVR